MLSVLKKYDGSISHSNLEVCAACKPTTRRSGKPIMAYEIISEASKTSPVCKVLPLPDESSKKAAEKWQVDLIGNSPSIREICSMIDLVADSSTPVLITGESGTGKEVVARMIHAKSRQAAMPFVAINCAAVPKEVFENELFGHEYGAFTGATARKPGYLELANKGTLFLDELAEMNAETQAKLLRVIETKSFRRLGGNQEIHVDVRMLSATNKDVVRAIRSGELRRDLYYRFSVIEIHLPPLNERKEDIRLLLDYFLNLFCQKHMKQMKKFTEESLHAMLMYDWPGNVRELRNAVERAVIVSPTEFITPECLPVDIAEAKPTTNFVMIPVGTSLKAAEKKIILQTLSSTRNNKSRAASVLGMTRKVLYKRLKQYGVTLSR